MTVLRPIDPQEFPALTRAVTAAFGGHEDDDLPESDFEFARSLALVDGDQIVGGAGAYSLSLTVPGPRPAPAAGVTWVGIMPTHQGQGLLGQLMRRQLDDLAAGGEAIAILGASESGLYERYGYGRASWHQHVAIDTLEATVARPAPTGTVELLDVEEARRRIPPIYETFRTQRVGMINRSDAYWPARRLPDPPEAGEGAGGRFQAVHRDGDGTDTAYAIYEIRQTWPEDLAGGQLDVVELVGTSPEAEAAMWQYLLGIALVRRVRARVRPVDEPFAWRLRDPRRFRTTLVPEYLWVRPVRLPDALAVRSYGEELDVVVEVSDAFLPANAGRWRLQVDGDGTSSVEVGGPGGRADGSLDIADLGSLLLGGVDPWALAAAGRLRVRDVAVLDRIRRAFTVHPAPFCNTLF